jgi:aspartyl-tRNA(Asn)/glutamyl-tRNA(Gln) amidotransferase subunit A
VHAADVPWQGDACSLVEAYRRGDRHPLDEVQATLAAIERSELNAFGFLDPDAALAAARSADVWLPFGGVPVGVKELDRVRGWPHTEASVVHRDRRSSVDATKVVRLRDGGAVLVGLTTASEHGFVNVGRTALNGVTSNPWRLDRTPGGSSGGSAAAVAGGLVPLATAGDGGGSVRIPASFCGLPGLKVTYGRVPKGPEADVAQLTAVPGVMARSVRDVARWLDVVNGHDARDPFSLPRVDGYERDLGSGVDQLRGLRVAWAPAWGNATVAPAVLDVVHEAATALVHDARLRLVDADTSLPEMGTAWGIVGLAGLWAEFAEYWPERAEDFTPEVRWALELGPATYSLDVRVKANRRRVAVNEAMARIFEQVDLVLAPATPDVAFGAADGPPSVFGGIEAGPWNNGRLTFPANVYGCPAISIPAGLVDGLPVGLQAVAPHFREDLLLDLALVVERERPWPLVAPGAPC